jgi:hypothetical protein
MWNFGIFRRFRQHPDLQNAIEHYKKVENVAPDAPICNILTLRAVRARIAAHTHADARAIRKQNRHWNAGSLAWIAGFLGVIVVPLELLPVEAWLPVWSPQVLNGVRAIGVLLMFCAIVLLGRRRSRAHWKEARVDAETVRADVFREIIERAGNHPAQLVQALACFRVAHLRWQLDFYVDRLASLPAKWRSEWWRALPFWVLGYVFSVGAGIMGSIAVLNFIATNGPTLPYVETVRVWLLMLNPGRWHDGLNITAATLLAFAGSRFLTHEDYSNAALYPWARDELKRLELEDLRRAESAAAAGDVQAVLNFRRKVQDVLDREHAVWSGETLPLEMR